MHSSRMRTARLLAVSGMGGGGGDWGQTLLEADPLPPKADPPPSIQRQTPPCGQTDTCQNITFPQLCLLAVIDKIMMTWTSLQSYWFVSKRCSLGGKTVTIYCSQALPTKHPHRQKRRNQRNIFLKRPWRRSSRGRTVTSQPQSRIRPLVSSKATQAQASHLRFF